MESKKTLGVMIDMSRNAVMSIDGLKRFLPLLKKMGYNCVMLYTEDTYEVDNEPYFGYMRGRYTKDEMKEIDAYAESLGLTVIPCIQTLAHLNGVFRWKQLPRDWDDILMIDDDRTYQLIDNMFKTLSECFKSRKIHVGMDEAYMVGRGRYLDKHGYIHSNELMHKHIKKVREIADKYGYQIMLWSDMFYKSLEKGEQVDKLPDSVIPVYWDYYHDDQNHYEKFLTRHKLLSNDVWFAGGVWCWSGFIPHNKYSLTTMVPAIKACQKTKTKNVIFTMWGDDGAECSHFTQLPALFYLAENVKGNFDEQKIKAKFKRNFGIDFDEFINIDCPNEVAIYDTISKDITKCPDLTNPSKYMLYSDYFNGFLDYTVKLGAGIKYKEFSKQLLETAKKSRKYGYVFKTASKLCDVLSIKYDLGLRTRLAYEKGDKQELKSLALKRYVKVYKLIEEFASVFKKQWFLDNKPHGFDIQEQRLGALLYRTKSCKNRILDYVNGKIDKIPELEEKLLPFGEKEKGTYLNKYPLASSVNSPHHNFVI